MIAQLLVDSGILQFGVFVENGKRVPYQLHLEMIPAYSELFTLVVNMVVQNLRDKSFDRLIAHSDCSVIGGAIAHQAGVSLVYSRSGLVSPVYDLVGAYDVGHPACLLVNTIPDNIETFIAGCRQVGLETHSVVALVAEQEATQNIPVTSVFSLESILTELYEMGEVTDPQYQAVSEHLAAKKRNRPIC